MLGMSANKPATKAQATPVWDRLQSLGGCDDAPSLQSAVRKLCEEFGKVMRIEVLTLADSGRRRALCFLQLESEAQEQRLISSLGASRFGNDVLVVVDLPLKQDRLAL